MLFDVISSAIAGMSAVAVETFAANFAKDVSDRSSGGKLEKAGIVVGGTILGSMLAVKAVDFVLGEIDEIRDAFRKDDDDEEEVD